MTPPLTPRQLAALRFILDVWLSVVVRGDVYALVRLDREKVREAGEVVGEMVGQEEKNVPDNPS